MKHIVTIMNGGSLAAGFVHGWRAYLKKDGWLRRAAGAVLMVQLCLAVFPARADSANPATPEGYRPLPVTKFVVEAEKDADYNIAVAVECMGSRDNSSDGWIKKNITGKVDLYRVKDNALISTHFVFNKKNDHSFAGWSRYHFNKHYEGEIYGIYLKKGFYIILPHLFFKEKASGHVPLAFVSFDGRPKLMK